MSEKSWEPQRFSVEQIEYELNKETRRRQFRKYIFNTLYIISGIAAIAIIVATLVMPVIRVYGTSMTPTVSDNEIAVTVRLPSFQRGDIIAFYYNNRILVKRVVGMPGDLVEVKSDGTVYINNEPLDEPYVDELSLEPSEVAYPVRVNEETYFVLGDNRAASVDSRSEAIGQVKQEDVLGKVFLTVWPPDKIRTY